MTLQSTSSDWWLGALAASVGHFLNGRSERKDLCEHYRDFLASSVVRDDPAFERELPPLPSKNGKRR